MYLFPLKNDNLASGAAAWPLIYQHAITTRPLWGSISSDFLSSCVPTQAGWRQPVWSWLSLQMSSQWGKNTPSFPQLLPPSALPLLFFLTCYAALVPVSVSVELLWSRPTLRLPDRRNLDFISSHISEVFLSSFFFFCFFFGRGVGGAHSRGYIRLTSRLRRGKLSFRQPKGIARTWKVGVCLRLG